MLAELSMRYEAAGGVVFDGDLVLVLERPSRSEFRLPKGHIEDGETAEAAAVREVAEESGYVDVAVDGSLGVERSEFDTSPDHGPVCHIIRNEHYFRMQLVTQATAERSVADLKFIPRWLPVGEAMGALTFEIEREWLRRAVDHG